MHYPLKITSQFSIVFMNTSGILIVFNNVFVSPFTGVLIRFKS